MGQDDWKLRQHIYHKITNPTEFGDQLDVDQTLAREYADESELVTDILQYFSDKDTGLNYPAKSYFVAIVYARCLQNEFGLEPYSALSDAELLYDNDPHFIPYNQARQVYDTVLMNLKGFDGIKLDRGQCPDVQKYFFKEFLLEG